MAFRWRHRMPRHPAEENGSELDPVEADETWLLESFKGQRHLPRPRAIAEGTPKRGVSDEQGKRLSVTAV